MPLEIVSPFKNLSTVVFAFPTYLKAFGVAQSAIRIGYDLIPVRSSLPRSRCFSLFNANDAIFPRPALAPILAATVAPPLNTPPKSPGTKPIRLPKLLDICWADVTGSSVNPPKTLKGPRKPSAKPPAN